MIRFYLKLDPYALDEEEWAEAVNGILWNLKQFRKLIWGSGGK